jgi:hypothetical protein
MSGNGFLNRLEVKHFVDKHFKYQVGLCDHVSEEVFNEWHKKLDSDGDG